MTRQLLKLGFVAAAGVGGWFAPATALKEIAAEVVAAFAVLAAFLVQFMLLLATVLGPGRLKAEQIREIAARLRDQQARTVRLFAAYITAILLFLATKLPLGWAAPGSVWHAYGLRAITCLATVVSVHSLIQTWAFLGSLRALQNLRYELMVREAEAREQDKRRKAMEKVAYVPPPSGASSFGRRHGT